MRERIIYISPKRLQREARNRERRTKAAKPTAREQKLLTMEEQADRIRRRWMPRDEGAPPWYPDPVAKAESEMQITS